MEEQAAARLYHAIQRLGWKYGTVRVTIAGRDGDATWVTWTQDGKEKTVVLDSFDDAQSADELLKYI